MTTLPHIAFGLFSGAAMASCYQMSDYTFGSRPEILAVAAVGAIAGSLAPDIDAPGTPASRVIPMLARSVQMRWPHRTLMHSAAAVLGTTLLVYWVFKTLGVFISPADRIAGIISSFWCAGYFGHLVVDSLTITGVKWMWPYHRAFAYPSVRRYRVRTGDRRPERYYTLFFTGLFLFFLPVLKSGGATKAIHRTFRDFQMAKADYLEASNVETFLTFKGSYRHNRKPLSGRALILDVENTAFLVHHDGNVLSIGENAMVIGTEYICEYTLKPPEYAELSFQSQSWERTLSHIPSGVLVTGHIAADRTFELSLPVYGDIDYPTIETSGLQMIFSYASPSDIASLGVRESEDVRELRTFVLTTQQELELMDANGDSLTHFRNLESGMVLRHRLLDEIQELRRKREALEKRLESAKEKLVGYPSEDVLFSGRLGFRKTP